MAAPALTSSTSDVIIQIDPPYASPDDHLEETADSIRSNFFSSLFSHYHQDIDSFQDEKLTRVTDFAINTLKLGTTMSPLLSMADGYQMGLAIGGLLFVSSAVSWTTQKIASYYAKRRNPITAAMSEIEKESKLKQRAEIAKKTGLFLKRGLEWAFNPIGNLASSLALKTIDSLQNRFTKQDSKAWRFCRLCKVAAHHSLRLISPSPWFALASIIHNNVAASSGYISPPTSMEMAQDNPYDFKASLAMKTITWERAPNISFPLDAVESIPREFGCHCQQLLEEQHKEFGISSPEDMMKMISSSMKYWTDYTKIKLSCVQDEGVTPDITFRIDSSIRVAAKATSNHDIFINPKPEIGPRWTDSIGMLPAVIAHEIGHLIPRLFGKSSFLKHSSEHYSIMHEGPRWEPGITAPTLPEVDILEIEKIIGFTAERQPGIQPVVKSFYTDFSYLFWLISESFSPLRIK
jgi:hypothetical protein